MRYAVLLGDRVSSHVTRYPTFLEVHRYSPWGVALGRYIAWLKILGTCVVLKALGKQREARTLRNAYSAFSVYNASRYDRSIRSAVDNCYALQVGCMGVWVGGWGCVCGCGRGWVSMTLGRWGNARA